MTLRRRRTRGRPTTCSRTRTSRWRTPDDPVADHVCSAGSDAVLGADRAHTTAPVNALDNFAAL